MIRPAFPTRGPRGPYGAAMLLQAPSVEALDRERAQVDIGQAAHVDRNRIRAALVPAEGEGRAAALRAELMPDDVLVEGVFAERRLRGLEPQRRAGREPQQEPLARAMRAVALHD